MDRDNPEKILVIQLRRLGDVLLTTPAVESLKRSFPQSRIDFLVEKAGGEILQNNPYISQIHIYKKSNSLQWIYFIRRQKYDWVLDFLGNPRTSVLTALSGARVKAGFNYPVRGRLYNHRAQIIPGRRSVVDFKLALLQRLGLSISHSGPAMYVNGLERQEIEYFLKKYTLNTNKILVGIAPASRRQTRQWLPEYYAQICDRLITRHNAHVIMLWGPGEEDVVENVRIRMKEKPIIPALLNLRMLGALIQQCSVVIANSNGPMHMAEALHVPTITIYGPNDPVSWESGSLHQEFLQAEHLACIRCNKNTCDIGHLCMKYIRPEMVEEKFILLLKRMDKNISHAEKLQT
ncbi:MAG: glycosyltransferase family 9 protein [bacterium]